MKPHHWLVLYFSCFCSYNSVFNMKCFRFNLVVWQNLDWLLFIKLLKHWIFVVFHPTDTSNFLTKIGYPLSFVVQTDTFDLLILIGYPLSFVIELDSSNLSIRFYKNNRKCFGALILDGFMNKTWEYEFWFDKVNFENLSAFLLFV